MTYSNLSNAELISKIEKLELDLIKRSSNNKKTEKAKDTSEQQNSLLKFINSMAIPSADQSSVEEFSKALLNAVKGYTGANMATFSLYQPDKKTLALLHIEAEPGILKTGIKIAGDKIVKMASPVDDETYETIIKTIVTTCNTFNEVSFGAIPKLIDKALRASTGIDRLYPIAHVIEGELYGTTMLAFKKGQTSPSIELLESYAHLMSVSLRRYNAEKALQDSEIKYRTYIEHAPLGITVADNKGEFIDLNPGVCELLGYTQNELLQLSIPDILADEKDMAGFQKLREERKLEDELKLKKKDGTVISVRIDSIILPNNESIAFLADITEQKKAEKEIKENQKRLSEAERIGKIGNWSIDIVTGNIEWSEGLYRIFGLAPEQQDISYELILGCIHEEDRNKQHNYFEKMQRLVPGQKLEPLEYRIVLPSGEIRWIDIDFETQFDKDNKPKSFFGTAMDITERKELLKTLQQRNAYIESILENMPIGFALNTISDGDAKYMNNKFESIYGWSKDILTNASIFFEKVFPDPEYRAKMQAKIVADMESGDPDRMNWNDLKIVTRSGDVRYVHAFNIPLPDQNLMISTVQDITVLRKAEDELIRSQEKLNLALQGGGIGVWELDLASNRSIWDARMKRMFGLNEGEFTISYDAFKDSLHPDDIASVENAIKSAIEGESPYDIIYRVVWKNKDVKYIHAKALISKDAEGHPITMIGICVDVSTIKEAEEALIKAKEKAEGSERKLIEAQQLAQVGSWEYIIDTETVTWSKEIFNIFERSHDLPAPNYSEQRLFYTKESFLLLDKAFQDCVQREIPYEIELDIIVSDGSTKQIIAKGNVIKDKNNKIIGSYGTAQDITQKKKIERVIIAAKEKAEESDRLKSAFLANMSHEIRTPMNGILGFSNLLKEPKLTGEQQQKYISIIEKSGERMLNIINDIIDVSKIEAGLMTMDITESDINEQLEYIYTFFRPEVEAKGMKLSLKDTLSSKGAIIKTDREKVFAILTNLVKNAIKYSNNGLIEMGCNPKGDALNFYVKDNGIGIPKNRQENIFERFIQADIEDKMARQGAGLGLTISKAYVEMLGGSIWVESQEENLPAGKVGGSTFYFTLPYNPSYKQEISSEDKGDTSLKLLKRNLEILIVEDDESSELLLEIMVENINEKIIKAKTGLEAIETCRNNPDIDLILMDIQLPGMNGYEVTRKIREFNKEVIIIAQTAYGLSGDREKAIKAGCNDYISKPIKQDELFALIQKHCKK